MLWLPPPRSTRQTGYTLSHHRVSAPDAQAYLLHLLSAVILIPPVKSITWISFFSLPPSPRGIHRNAELKKSKQNTQETS